MSPAAAASPWGTRAEREAGRAQKRLAVLTAAARSFNEKGFHATSLDDVAATLEVTKPTIYHYFGSKDEILFECVRRGLTGIRDAAEEARRRGGSGRERLVALAEHYARIMTDDFGRCIARTSDTQLTEDSRRRYRALKREIHDTLAGVIAEGTHDSSLAPVDPQLAAFAVAGALNAIGIWYRAEGAMSPDEVARRTVATLISGLAPRSEV